MDNRCLSDPDTLQQERPDGTGADGGPQGADCNTGGHDHQAERASRAGVDPPGGLPAPEH